MSTLTQSEVAAGCVAATIIASKVQMIVKPFMVDPIPCVPELHTVNTVFSDRDLEGMVPCEYYKAFKSLTRELHSPRVNLSLEGAHCRVCEDIN